MKGLVFTTFYDFCETNFSADLLDDIIAESGVPHDGAYTSVGTYPFEEMVALVTSATAVAGIGLRSLLERFGEHCFNKWVGYVPAHFQGKDLFDVLASIDTFHEDEVRKLYPDAELPSFVVESRSARELTLCYFSCKPLADLATGVIIGASKHLRDPVDIHHRAVADGDRPHVRFTITRLDPVLT